ncbi:MAG: DUF305 domain-containing protein [Rhodospirillaceae bacterium]
MRETQKTYLCFFSMIATSMAVMFGLMYLNSYEMAHVRWSETRFYMTLIMGAGMAVVMLSFMLGMYENSKVNALIYSGSVVVFLASLWLVRSQSTVDDNSWMKAMIPHHSIAILTSERANINDARVQALAKAIIEAQRREIKEMEWMLKDIEANGVAKTEAEAAARPVPDFDVNT